MVTTIVRGEIIPDGMIIVNKAMEEVFLVIILHMVVMVIKDGADMINPVVGYFIASY